MFDAYLTTLKGWPAWWLWGAAHVYFLVSLRNRLIVVTQWLWSYAFFERGARLITGLGASGVRSDSSEPTDG
jgi:NADH dehydrogenase